MMEQLCDNGRCHSDAEFIVLYLLGNTDQHRESPRAARPMAGRPIRLALYNPRRFQLFDFPGAVAERSQDVVVMFAEIRRGRTDFTVEAGDLAGLRHQIELAKPRMSDRSLDAQCLDLRIGERLLDIVDGAAR